MGHGVVAAIAFGVSRVTKEDTQDGTGSEFVRGGGGNTGVTTTTEDPKTVVGWRRTKQEVMWRIVLASTTRTEVDKKCGGGQGVGPEGGRDVAMEEKGADAVVEGAEDMLGTAVLLRCVWTS